MSKEKGPRERAVTGPIWMSSLLLQCLRREPSAGEIVPQIKSEARLQWRGLTKQCETEATLIEDNPAAWNELVQPASCTKLNEDGHHASQLKVSFTTTTTKKKIQSAAMRQSVKGNIWRTIDKLLLTHHNSGSSYCSLGLECDHL